ncbi:phage minor tail protein [Escherichia coli]|uniref:Phage minor tail protein n=1 Tax=Escherichia coli TaxID=562 RepID=A0A376KX03_ECOLX|nr:phage minor tail protein [Escherichia coli]
MQDIRQETLNECTRTEQSASLVLWEIDLTEIGGERYFFSNEPNEKGEAVTWQGRKYEVYPVQGAGFEMKGKGSSARPTLTVSNLYGMVTGMVEDLQSLAGGTVIRRKVYARFLDAVNFTNGNSEADPEQEVISYWRIEQCSDLTAVTATFVLASPAETDGAVFPDVPCWPTPVPGPIAVMSAVITVRLSRMNMTSRRLISRRINAVNA